MKFIIAQIVGIIATVCNCIGIQFKEKRQILFTYIIANALFAVNFLLLESYTGMYITCFCIFETLISYLLMDKNIKITNILIYVFITINIIIGVASFQSFIDVLPVIGSILYVIIIFSKEEKTIRDLTFIALIVWIVYDFFVMAYTNSYR